MVDTGWDTDSDGNASTGSTHHWLDSSGREHTFTRSDQSHGNEITRLGSRIANSARNAYHAVREAVSPRYKAEGGGMATRPGQVSQNTQSRSVAEAGHPNMAGSTGHMYGGRQVVHMPHRGMSAGPHAGGALSGKTGGFVNAGHALGSPHSPVSHPGSPTHHPMKKATGQRGHATVHPPVPHTSVHHPDRHTRPHHQVGHATAGTQHTHSSGSHAGHPAHTGHAAHKHSSSHKSKGHKSKGHKSKGHKSKGHKGHK